MRIYIPVLVALAFSTNLPTAYSQERGLGIQISTGLYPSLQRIMYLSDPPRYGPVLPHFRYPGCIATPGINYNWKNKILSAGIRLYLPEINIIRTGAELTYDWIHRRPGKAFNHTFGGSLLYDFRDKRNIFYQNNITRHEFRSIRHEGIIYGSAGLRKELGSRFSVSATTGIGFIMPFSSFQMDGSFTGRSGEHPLRLGRPSASLMFKIGVGWSFQ